MVNRNKRDKARTLIQEFLGCRITNFEFAYDFPRDKHDRALRAIEAHLWFFYDDLRTHKLEGKHKLGLEGEELFRRCVLFLSADLEYEWPDFAFSSFLYSIMRLFGRGQKLAARFEDFKKKGDYEVWPFIRMGDYLKYEEMQHKMSG